MHILKCGLYDNIRGYVEVDKNINAEVRRIENIVSRHASHIATTTTILWTPL